ncbi:biotin--protein ligase [Desulfovibrio sp. OttesenSCG-928-C06]|nr:biotin--protein ligase [Desulfovibrio sp. OttesenSCG-928-C06]
MSRQSLYILWDESHIWGLMAWRAALGLGVPFRMVRAKEIADGLLQKEPCAVLLVPGGTARHKARALGPRGLQNIRSYVDGGGHYLGFCGGAGLGLTLSSKDARKGENAISATAQDDEKSSAESLNLCPWARASFEDRMQHFMSGHLEASLTDKANLPEFAHRLLPDTDIKEDPVCSSYGSTLRTGETLPKTPENGDVLTLECGFGIPLIPVWWPGRFMPGSGDVAVLARYSSPGPDFWLADLPIALLPKDAFSSWRELYGINFSPAFLEGQPCVIHGKYGSGTYTLSYSHLETPNSPFANNWLAHILKTLGNIEVTSSLVPQWKPKHDAAAKPEHLPGLEKCIEDISRIINTGIEHGLFFKRNDWLFGWRAGMPGSAINSLNSVLLSCAALEAGEECRRLWLEKQAEICAKSEQFSAEVINYLLAERLAMTLSKTAPEAISPGALKARKQSLFGPPMKPVGLYADLIGFFEELLFLQFSAKQ